MHDIILKSVKLSFLQLRKTFTSYKMSSMKKTGMILLCAVVLCGCTQNKAEEPAEKAGKSLAGDAYTLFSDELSSAEKPSSASYSVMSEYQFRFSDDTLSFYTMDGVLESDDADQEAHLTQHILANGMNSNMESYYYDDTLFNEYNGITYYENMTFSDVKELMLVPLEPYAFPSQLIESITAEESTEGNHIYTITISESSRKDYFGSHYDFYGVSGYDDAAIKSGTVVDTFDPEGRWIGEKAEFVSEFTYQEQKIEATYTSEVSVFNLNATSAAADDELRKEHQSYVAAADIDTSQIGGEGSYDDTPEETVSATFKKRLINRLGYEEIEGGAVQMIYNTNEAYTVDFANKTFIYSNYSINYVYSWQGDLISMGACTYDFGKDLANSECTDSTVEKMKDVKNYLVMELYYCGLSFEDLQAEN